MYKIKTVITCIHIRKNKHLSSRRKLADFFYGEINYTELNVFYKSNIYLYLY